MHRISIVFTAVLVGAMVGACGHSATQERKASPKPHESSTLPLPSGVKPGAKKGEYVNVKDGTILVWVPAGSFEMGSKRPHEGPVHEVTFKRGFFIGKYETTWKQYRAFCAATGRTPPDDTVVRSDWKAKPTDPVFNVSWEDAQAYCKWAGLRLPSEAEWEYAARGSDGRTYPWGNEPVSGSRCNAGNEVASGNPTPVGSHPGDVSPFGCMDMAGNVAEWCEDVYHETYRGAPTDGSAWLSGGSKLRVPRGGSWYGSADDCRSASRLGCDPTYTGNNLGFRPALSSP